MSQQHTTEPVALVHAEWLEKSLTIGAQDAAAELRRLHDVEQQRDELLAARDSDRRRLESMLAGNGVLFTVEAVSEGSLFKRNYLLPYAVFRNYKAPDKMVLGIVAELFAAFDKDIAAVEHPTKCHGGHEACDCRDYCRNKGGAA